MTNQKPSSLAPGPLADMIGYRVRVAQLAAYRQFEAKLRRFGSAPRYLGLLAIIGHQPGQAQSRLAEAISVQRSSLVAIIDRLADEGLVERRASTVDRRANAVWLTEKGNQMLADLTRRAQHEDQQLGTGMTADDRTTLLRLLRQIAENLA